MNSNLKPSAFSPEQNSQTSLHHSRQSLALVKSTSKVDQPTQQQQEAIARIYVEQAWIYFQDKNWQNAVVACKNALESDCKNADAYRILGNILKLKGRKAEALGVYAKALEINPNSATIYANLGSFYAEQKKWQEALDYYQQAVILDPQFAGAYRNLAQVWEELGDTNQALECLCQAVNLEPEKLTAQEYFDFARELYEQGKLVEASVFYTRGVELNPRAESELTQLVQILEELEEWQQAVVYYHKLISLSGANGEQGSSVMSDKPIRNLLSHAKINESKKAMQRDLASPKGLANPLGLHQEAIAKLSDSARSSSAKETLKLLPTITEETINQSPTAKQPDSAISWNNLGSLYAQKQQWNKAISCYQEAVELDPKLSKSYRNLARVYSKTDKKEQATLCWYEAFTLEPSLVQPEEYFSLAKKLLQQDQVDKAIACLRRAIEQKADFSQADLLLSKLYEQQGKIVETKACYENVTSN
jgi:tetratricopeptide (TPR) repeat protein